MRKSWFAVPLAVTLAGVSLAGLAAWGFADVATSSSTSAEATPAAADEPAVAPAGQVAAPSATPSSGAAVAASPSTSTSAGTPKVRRSNAGVPLPRRSDISEALPPTLPRRSGLHPGTGCPFHEGVDAAKADVRVALETAAQKPFWANDPRYASVTLPPALIKAVAWMESGWQSTIVACDGGIGTMQIMPDTATWMNQRFGTSYDLHTLGGNTMIGAEYLQWLIAYFGSAYFGSDYTLDAADCVSTDPAVPDYQTPCLLNAVIAAYNYGPGNVEVGDHIVIPNPDYVRPVRALMVSCPCSQY
ncbi:soluble lytic murein transglycosylase-like protein [Hamadaea flava]|uniref:Transglycosylase SLT domain-containing protein n=1 Tax=Hamadaea flava TaxID=1742688 RepID=A0ABV8LSS2_9ACTN|nr:transglycosylase SLT domain-containing protein [Hamadaea flava]MCP2328073.1 soluble lytic murein transglycosylase-like protein [Hamadaea flava]